MTLSKYIELLRIKIALWLLDTKTATAATSMMLDRHTALRCDHCGLSPFHEIDNCECEVNNETTITD